MHLMLTSLNKILSQPCINKSFPSLYVLAYCFKRCCSQTVSLGSSSVLLDRQISHELPPYVAPRPTNKASKAELINISTPIIMRYILALREVCGAAAPFFRPSSRPEVSAGSQRCRILS